MKTKEELQEIKTEYESLSQKLAELTDEELKQVTGGEHCGILVGPASMIHAPTFDDLINEGEISPVNTHAWFGGKE